MSTAKDRTLFWEVLCAAIAGIVIAYSGPAFAITGVTQQPAPDPVPTEEAPSACPGGTLEGDVVNTLDQKLSSIQEQLDHIGDVIVNFPAPSDPTNNGCETDEGSEPTWTAEEIDEVAQAAGIKRPLRKLLRRELGASRR